MPALPEHLMIGRSNTSGPRIGAYLVVSLGPYTVGTTASTDTFSFVAPCDLRLQRIQWGTYATAVADVDADWYKNTAGVVDNTDGSSVQLNTAIVSMDTDESGYIEAAAGGSTTLVEAARNIAKGDVVFCDIQGDAVDSALADLNMQYIFVTTGFVNANAAND